MLELNTSKARRTYGQGMRFSGAILFFVLVAQAGRLVAAPNQLLCNPEGPWGLPGSSPVFGGLALGALLFLALQWRRERTVTGIWPWVLLFAGGLSNLGERLLLGCITDYLRLGPLPVFNLADVFLTLGVLGLFWRWQWKRNEEV